MTAATARKQADKPAADAPVEQPRQVGMIVPTRVQFAEHGRNIHLVTAPAGTQPGDFLHPEYWGMVAKNFQPYDQVEVRTDDRTFWGLFLVLASDRTWAKLHPIHQVELPSAEEPAAHAEFEIEWKGPHLKYCVIRKSDRSIVHEGEQERTGAGRWLDGYVRTIGRPSAPPR